MEARASVAMRKQQVPGEWFHRASGGCIHVWRRHRHYVHVLSSALPATVRFCSSACTSSGTALLLRGSPPPPPRRRPCILNPCTRNMKSPPLIQLHPLIRCGSSKYLSRVQSCRQKPLSRTASKAYHAPWLCGGFRRRRVYIDVEQGSTAKRGCCSDCQAEV